MLLGKWSLEVELEEVGRLFGHRIVKLIVVLLHIDVGVAESNSSVILTNLQETSFGH